MNVHVMVVFDAIANVHGIGSLARRVGSALRTSGMAADQIAA